MIFYPPSQTFLNIRFYSIFMALAMILGGLLSYFISKKYYKEINLDFLLDLMPILIISGILGARIYYVLLNLNYFMQNKMEMIMIYHGGISIHGALLGAIIGAYIYSKIKKINLLPYLDVLSYGAILGQAIGRLGNFFNSEAFGAPSDFIIKLYVAPQFRPLQYVNFQYFHPTFFYEILWNLLVLALLFFVVRKIAKNKAGVLFFSYLILYSIGRFLIEQIRIDSVFNIGTIPIAQIASIFLIIIGILGLLKIKKA